MIEIENASKIYRMGEERIHALDNLSLEIGKGDFFALIGPSGSGKSTLMNVVGALDDIDEGSIMVEGVDISRMGEKDKAIYRRNRIGFIFQTFNLQRRLTALENVELPLIFDKIPPRERKDKAQAALDTVQLTNRMLHRPTELSGGQQQRVAIARAIVNSPDVLLADEPTGNLDSKTGMDIIDLLKELNDKNDVTVLMVTHNEEHANFADKVLHMRDGKIMAEDDTE